MSVLYRKALIFAAKKHAGQKRNNGEDYIIHPIRVSQGLETERQRVMALLHDVLEDTDTTYDELEEEFGPIIAQGVQLLTHRDGWSGVDYIRTLKCLTDTTAVKLADIADNLYDSPSDHAIKKSAKWLTMLVT